MDKQKIIEKWEGVFGKIGLTGSQLENISQLAENQSNQILEETKTEEFPTLLPIARQVAAKTIFNDLFFASDEEIKSVKDRVIQENRDGKLGSILEDEVFVEKRLEDDDEYKKLKSKGVSPLGLPTGQLFYIDYKYGDSEKKSE
jgi:hypothetical protein